MICANTPGTWLERFHAWLQPHSVFLALAIPFGLAVLLANPPYQAPDENDHYFRAYQLSEGGIVGRKQANNAGGDLPALVYWHTDMGKVPFHPDEKVRWDVLRKKWQPLFVDLSKEPRNFFPFPHTVVYPPSNYVPQTLAILAGRLAHVTPVGLMYLARLAGFAVSVWLGYTALRLMPVFRWSCLLLLLAPMSLYLMGSIAPDGMLITASCLLAALLGRFATGAESHCAGKTQAMLLAIGAMLAVAKFVYLPLVALVPLFVIPRLSGTRRRMVFGILFVALCAVPLWLWGRVMTEVYVPGRTDIPIDPHAQARFVIEHPWNFLTVAAKTIWTEAGGHYRWFVGTLGWLDTSMPNWFYWAFGLGVSACLMVESSDGRAMSWPVRLLVVGAAAATTLLIMLAQYISWNAPGSQGPIHGLSGRYFFPVALFLALGFPSVWRLRAPGWGAPIIGVTLSVISVTVCLWSVVTRYYVS